VRSGRLIERETRSDREDAARGRRPSGNVGLRSPPIRVRNAGKGHRINREVFLHQFAHRHLGFAVAVGRVDQDAAVDPQATQRCGKVAAEIDLGDVIDADPVGDVEDARGNILFSVVDDVRRPAGAGALCLFRRADSGDHPRPGPGGELNRVMADRSSATRH